MSNESGVSVITVTFNNVQGLARTLNSLAALQHPPLEVVIVDGGSNDGTAELAAEFSDRLPIRFESGPDAGIYDAMNKGRARARGRLVHYLNGGDKVYGEPYRRANEPALMPVQIINESGQILFNDFIKHHGWGYCHQGILFPVDHPEYNIQYCIAADFDLIIRCFHAGLDTLPWITEGGVHFALGGISSTALDRRDSEMRQIIRAQVPPLAAMRLRLVFALRDLLPRFLRHKLVAIRQRLR